MNTNRIIEQDNQKPKKDVVSFHFNPDSRFAYLEQLPVDMKVLVLKNISNIKDILATMLVSKTLYQQVRDNPHFWNLLNFHLAIGVEKITKDSYVMNQNFYTQMDNLLKARNEKIENNNSKANSKSAESNHFHKMFKKNKDLNNNKEPEKNVSDENINKQIIDLLITTEIMGGGFLVSRYLNKHPNLLKSFTDAEKEILINVIEKNNLTILAAQVLKAKLSQNEQAQYTDITHFRSVWRKGYASWLINAIIQFSQVNAKNVYSESFFSDLTKKTIAPHIIQQFTDRQMKQLIAIMLKLDHVPLNETLQILYENNSYIKCHLFDVLKRLIKSRTNKMLDSIFTPEIFNICGIDEEKLNDLLRYAIKKNNASFVHQLINNHIHFNPNVVDELNTSLLHLAILKQQPSIVEFLLKDNADLNVISKHYQTPLKLILSLAKNDRYNHDLQRIQELIEAEIDKRNKSNQESTTHSLIKDLQSTISKLVSHAEGMSNEIADLKQALKTSQQKEKSGKQVSTLFKPHFPVRRRKTSKRLSYFKPSNVEKTNKFAPQS